MELAGRRVVDLSDACDELGVPAVRTGALTATWSGCPALTGPVATLSMRPATGAGGEVLPDILRALSTMAGQVVLVDLEGRTDLQCWGGVLTACAQRFGILGAIVNGAVRDTQAIADGRFPVFAGGVHPARIRGRLRVDQVGGTVRIGDGLVKQGDLVAADSDGVLFLPRQHQQPVVRAADERVARETVELDRLATGADPLDVFGRSRPS